MSFCRTIGKKFKSSGLEDIFVESDVIGPGSINGMLSGKHYNRCVMIYTLLYEVLEKRRFTLTWRG